MSSFKEIVGEIRFKVLLSRSLVVIFIISGFFFLQTNSLPQTKLSSTKVIALLFLSLTFILTYWVFDCRSSSLARRSQSKVASFAAKVRAMYSVSIDDKVTVSCLFKHQLIGSPLSIKMKLEVDFWLFLSLANQNPSIFW